MTARMLVLTLLVTVGCVSAPVRRDVDLDVVPPAAWAVDHGEPDDAWWESFDDARLDGLIAAALERNHDLAAAAARVDRAMAEARIAGADLRPTLGTGLDASRQKQAFVGLPLVGGTGVVRTLSSRFDLSLQTSWEADLWGRLRAGARAAVADAQASRADLRAARQSLAALTSRAWFLVVESRQQLALARETAASFAASLDQVESRFRSGLRPAVELRLARSSLSAAEANVHLRREILDAASRQLELLVGRYPDRAFADALTGDQLPGLPEPPPAGLPSNLVGRRPDVVAAERRLAAADQRLVASRRELYPRLTLTASGGTASDALGDLLDGNFSVWSLIGGLTQPLFQGGRLRAGVERSDALARESLERYAQTALSAYAEVELALAAETTLAERERHLGDSARELTAARVLAEERYRSGVGLYLVVLESQSRELTARSALLDVRRQRLDNRVDLHLALGGGFDDHEDPS